MYDKHATLRMCLDEYCKCAKLTSWRVSKRSKARLRVLMAAACKKDPNTSLTYAWASDRGNPIPIDHVCFDQVVEFLGKVAQPGKSR